GFRETQEAINLVAHVAEAASLASIAIYCQVLTEQSLLHKVGHNATVVYLHARTVRVEDAHDPSVQIVIPAVGHRYSFCKTFCFVVDRTRADRIHMPPVRFALRMFQGISVTLRG